MKNIYLLFGFFVIFGSCQKANQGEIQTTESVSHIYGLSLSTNYKTLPNLTIGYNFSSCLFGWNTFFACPFTALDCGVVAHACNNKQITKVMLLFNIKSNLFIYVIISILETKNTKEENRFSST